MPLKQTYVTSGPDTTDINLCISENTPRFPKEKLLLTASEAAYLLSLAPRTIYALVETGKLPCVRIGKAVRIPRKAVMDLAGVKE
jgi:excisionase family DNA binding protein